MNNFLFAETVPVNNFLFAETVSVNNLFLKKNIYWDIVRSKNMDGGLTESQIFIDTKYGIY